MSAYNETSACMKQSFITQIVALKVVHLDDADDPLP